MFLKFQSNLQNSITDGTITWTGQGTLNLKNGQVYILSFSIGENESLFKSLFFDSFFYKSLFVGFLN